MSTKQKLTRFAIIYLLSVTLTWLALQAEADYVEVLQFFAERTFGVDSAVIIVAVLALPLALIVQGLLVLGRRASRTNSN